MADLCQETGASEATIRRDLNELDRQGKLSKVHGGAVLPKDEFQSQEPDILTKSQLNVEQKQRIARYAAAQVNDDDFVLYRRGHHHSSLMAGSPDGNSRAAYVTTALARARKAGKPRADCRVDVAWAGSFQSRPPRRLVGAAATGRSIAALQLHARSFIGANGVRPRCRACTTPEASEAAVQAEALSRWRG